MDKVELFNNNNFVYFSMWIEAKKNEETNQIKKIPHFPKGYKDMTTSTIFNKNHSIIAIRTGVISNIFVIDIDDLTNEIAKKLNEICFNNCEWKVSTRKGYHYYFKYDERLNNYKYQSKASNINNKLGFDTRGNGGIIFYGKYNYGEETYKYTLLEKEPKLIEMNNEIFGYVKLLLTPNTENNDEIEINTKSKKISIGIKYDGKIDKIPIDIMLKYIDCLDDKHFVGGYELWRNIFFMCYNCNNDNLVVNALYKRSKIGKYSNITIDECKKQFFSNEYFKNFNTYVFVKIAREDNFNNKYNEYFGEYDKYDFEYKIMSDEFFDEKNKNKLNYSTISKYFNNEKYCVIKSPYGSGKTTYIKKLIKNKYNDEINKKRIIFLVMRQSLSYDLENDMKELGFKNYLNKDKVNHNDDKIIISLDSLRKITYKKLDKTYIKKYDLVICDEFCSLLSHFDFKKIEDVESLYNLFENVIINSNQTYFLDGDISNREVKYLQNYLNYTGKPLFNNKVSRKFNMNLTYNKDEYHELIMNDLTNNRKICIPSMSSNFCEIIKEKYKKYNVLVYNQKTDDSIKKGLINIEELIKNYDIFVYSPSITVGVNIDFKYFHSIYGYMCNSVCARVYYQMLFRVRNIVNDNINILVDNTIRLSYSPFQHFKEIKSTLYDDDYNINAFEYIKLWNKWESLNNNIFLNVFKYYTNLKGFNFNINNDGIDNDIDCDDTEDGNGKNKDINPNNPIDKILECELIDNKTYNILSNKVKNLEATTEDKYKIEKYIYFTKFKLDKFYRNKKEFKNKYYKKLHILKGYLYNKFYNDRYKVYNDKLFNNICRNIKKNSANYDDKENKYKTFYNLNKNVESLDTKYYNNKFDKKIIELKHKYFTQLENILKDKNGIINKNVLVEKKDDLIKIFNNNEFKLIFEERTLIEPTQKKIIGSINKVYNTFGMEVYNIQSGTSKNRIEHLEINKMDCIPLCYVDYEEYVNKYKYDCEEYMNYFIKLVEEKKNNKKKGFKDLTIEDFIIDLY